MVLIFKSLIAAILGIALGLAVTVKSIERGVGFGAVRAGPWTGWPKSGARDADPYTRAARARSGQIPLGITEGLTFVASGDDKGGAFDPKCDYLITGATPPARFWTMTAMTPSGDLIETKGRRHGFTSSELTRDAAGGFAIVVAGQARPGNWLPVSPAAPYALAFRLYDTSLSAAAYSIDAGLMPSITRGRCA